MTIFHKNCLKVYQKHKVTEGMRIEDEAGKNSCQTKEAMTSEIRNRSLFHMNKDSIMSKGSNKFFLRKGEM